MRKHRTTRFRPSLFETLEDRAVPSVAAAAAAATTSATTKATTTAAKAATLKADLNAIGAEVNIAYSAFATAVRQAETSLAATATATTPATTAAATTRVTQDIAALATGIAAAINGVNTTALTGQARAIAAIQGGLTDTTIGSLSTELSTLLAAASQGSTGGTADPSALPALYAAVEGAISSSYESTAVEIYLYEKGHVGSTATATSAATNGFDATGFGTAANAAYSTFATAARLSEATLAGTAPAAGSSVSPPLLAEVATLSQSLGTALAGSTNTAVIQARFLPVGGPGSLSNTISRLLAAAGGSATGTVPQAALPVVYSAIEGATNASYVATAIQGYFLGTGTTGGF